VSRLRPQLRGALIAAAGALCASATSGQSLTTDVPARGALVYERLAPVFAVTPRPLPVKPEWCGGDDGITWRWLATAATPPAGFEQRGFDDAAWSTGRGEFGSEPPADGLPHVAWTTKTLCLRATVDLGSKKPKALCFAIDHDDGIRVFLNGKPILANDGYGRGHRYLVGGAALDSWQRGDNTIAVSCDNIGGLQYCSVRVGVVASLPPSAKTFDELQRTLTDELDAAQRARNELFGPLRPPPILLQGELDAARQRIRIAPGDLRDLGHWLATDLSCGNEGGALQLDANRMFRLGDVQLRGRATAIDGDGWQTLEVTVKTTPEPALRDDSKRHVDRNVKPFVWYGFEGKLLVKRRLTAVAGPTRVAEFSVDLGGRLLRNKEKKEPVADLVQRETCRLVAARENQDPEFRVAVGEAIARGTKRLREQLADLTAPNLAPAPADATDSYGAGRLALGLLGVLKGGVPKPDEGGHSRIAELRRRTLIDTYTIGNAIMVLEALHAPPREVDDLLAGRIDRPRPRTLPPDDLRLVQRWADQLLQNVDTRVDPAAMLRFNYTRGQRFDNSVNQYGLLGLYAAHLCGVDVPATVWEAAANHLLASQCPEGAKVELELVDYRARERQRLAPEDAVTSARTSQRACGWSYHEPKDDGELTPVWGSMTCAGITGLAICQAALAEDPVQKRLRLQADATRARRDAFAWLARWMTSRAHPGAIERQQRWFYYYLYGLERAALLSGVALIQDRDWYFEGAMVLVHLQAPDGNWPAELLPDEGIERNAMAILFLKQGTSPVLTGR